MKRFYILLVALFVINGAIGQSCLPEGITFNTQSEIDSFPINHPNCKQIEGDVRISGGDITNLIGLSVLTTIGGKLYIRENFILTSLTGLDNLTSIGGDLTVSYNRALTSLTGLDNIDKESITNLYIIGNSSLSTCEMQSICNYLASPSGIVNIFSNATGCNSPSEIANACNISLPCLPYGNYYFETQTEIDNFPINYPNCTELEGEARIQGSNATNVDGLSDITSIGENLIIAYNDSLTSLLGLNSLTFIGGDLIIGMNFFEIILGNPALTSLTGLGNVTSIGGVLQIANNGVLTNLSGLENVNAGSITYLSIYNNVSLSTCAVQSICDYLASPNGTINIHDNALGCNSLQEVEAACATLSVDNKTNDNAFSIYPNPASTELTIESTTNGQLSILNLSGQQLITSQLLEPKTQIDIRNMPSGVYFVRVTGAMEVQVGKFMKQ